MYKNKVLGDERHAMICDFCAGFHPTHVYAAGRMSTGLRRECWRWAACEHCHAAIEELNWGALRERIKNAFVDFMPAMPDELVEHAITVSLQEFFDWAITESVQ